MVTSTPAALAGGIEGAPRLVDETCETQHGNARVPGESRAIAANPGTYGAIRQFLPDLERDLGLGLSDRQNPILQRAGLLRNGARRIRTADLLGAIQGGR